MLLYQKFIKREDLRANPHVLYVFGDNLGRVGMGGQAREMRGEPNAVGIPTKKHPDMDESSFFTDEDYTLWYSAIALDLLQLTNHSSKNKGIIIWPLDDIGTGLAELPTRAPLIHKQIQFIKLMLR